jgi:hypothetical protein
MQKLNIVTETLDQDNTFAIELQKRRGTIRVKCSVRKDYKVRGDGILWALQHGASLQSHYSAKDVAERNRLNNNEPVRHGDIVIIDGKQYAVRVIGDYSNCAVFDPLAA